jgi:hypothetical protein
VLIAHPAPPPLLLPLPLVAAARCGLDVESESAVLAALPRLRCVLLLGLFAPRRFSLAALALLLLRLEVVDLAMPDCFMARSWGSVLMPQQ